MREKAGTKDIFMGSTWEVYAWKEVDGEHKYTLVYAGESIFTAMNEARKEKKSGCKCIKIEWRP